MSADISNRRPAEPAVTAGPPVGPRAGPLAPTASWVRALVRRPGLTLAGLFVALVCLAAIFPSLFTADDPDATDGASKLMAPSAQHWFGTDELGRDQFSRVIHGAGLTLEGAVISVGFACVIGLALGVTSGFIGGRVDAALMRLLDVVLAIPPLLLALTIVTALGFGTVRIGFAVGLALTPAFARATRAEVLRVRTHAYIEAARTGGASWTRVMIRHILPNSWGTVAALAVLDVGTAIIAIAALSFLGLGPPPPNADWGSLIADGSNYLITSSWLALLPGLFVVAFVFSVNHIGLTLADRQQ